MSLPLLIRQIFADLIINGSHQNFRFRSDPSGVLHLKNEFAITDLIPALMDLKLGDVNHNSFTLRYSGFTDFSKNEFGLYVVKNSVLDPVPVFKINHATKEFTFISKAYFTKDDGTTALIGSGGGSGGITQAQLDNAISALNIPTGSLATQSWVTSQGYSTGGSTFTYDTSLYTQLDTIETRINAYYKPIAYKVKYIVSNATLFEDYTSFRIPTEVGFGTGYSYTDSSNYEWSFRERNSSASLPLLQFKTIAGVKSLVAPYKIQASGWTPSSTTDLTTKGSVDTAINTSSPVGTIILFIQNVNSGLILPTGWLQCNGSTFSSTTYPDLFLARSSTTLPNLTAPNGAYYIVKALKTSL